MQEGCNQSTGSARKAAWIYSLNVVYVPSAVLKRRFESVLFLVRLLSGRRLYPGKR